MRIISKKYRICRILSLFVVAAFILSVICPFTQAFALTESTRQAAETHTLSASYTVNDGTPYIIAIKYKDDAEIPDEAELTVSEPAGEEYETYCEIAADVLEEEQTEQFEIRLLDITIRLEEEEIQPQAPVTVIISSETVPIQDDAQIVHFGEEPEVVESTAADGEVQFSTDGFSVYAIIEKTIETVVLSSDGNSYRITVSCPPGAGVPEDAALLVEEITGENALYEVYEGGMEDLLGYDSPLYFRVFDITITDLLGEKIEITTPVRVTIEPLTDGEADSLPPEIQVLHFPDEEPDCEQINNVDVDGETVSFTADGFSAYAIVAGPGNQAMGWVSVTTMAEFEEYAAEGLYIGHTSGYFFKNNIVSDSGTNPRTGIGKTKPAQTMPDVAHGAVKYYFESAGAANQYYIYCYSGNGEPGNTKQYVHHESDGTASNLSKSLSFTDGSGKTAFTVSLTSKGFRINDDAWYWNMQGSAAGNRFCVWNTAADTNNYLTFWSYIDPGDDPFGLDGKRYGLMSFANGITGIGMLSTSSEANHLDALTMTVLTNKDDHSDRLFVPKNTDIPLWTFHWVEGAGDGNVYTLSTNTDDGVRYLRITAAGLSLSETPCNIQIIPGTGVHNGEICLKSMEDDTLTYCGSVTDGFSVGNSTVGSEWLNLVELSFLTEDYYMTYAADKVSVSDSDVTNGSRIIIYTRSWNETKKRYEFYAIDHDGHLVQVYESGNEIQWVGNRINTLLWDFVEYYWEGTDDPNGYYELFNEYSQMYVAPQLEDDQLLSENTIGVNLNGRKNGSYYTTVLAWDPAAYAYAGLKVVDGHIVVCPKEEAMDFYFAIMQDQSEDDSLHTVPTIDNTMYGVTVKMIDFNTAYAAPNGSGTITTSLEQHTVLGDSTGGAVKYPNTGLLSTNLGADGYPTATKTGKSLSELYDEEYLMEVNHLFVKSIYDGTGYFEYDSAQNSASLLDPITGEPTDVFTVYRELATHDKKTSNTLMHGQFLPFNDIMPGHFAETNAYNNCDIFGAELPDSDPRKGERLYKVDEPDFFFGMELEASFIQTPDGKDAWDHDIIYEFTGDDDFWLYVDGELVLDLGGIHSALPGTVNFCTGEVTYPNRNGRTITTTLYNIFRQNYIGRGMSESEATTALAEIFKQENGRWIFKDYTTHTMKIFYMERGGGASNLHMRFNLSSVKKGTVQLSKTLSGVDDTETVLAEFPYQVFYTVEDTQGNFVEHMLSNTDTIINPPVYKGTVTQIPFHSTLTFDGLTYSNVYMLKPGETAEIEFPDNTMSYRIVECGVDTNVYSHVYVNGDELTGATAQSHASRMDFDTGSDTVEARTNAAFSNEVDPSALRDLTFTKKLYDVTGLNEIHYDPDNPVTFSFRLYFGTEFDSGLETANMYTYHVKNEAGEYCKWSSSLQRFVTLGKTDYSTLTAEEKTQASFATSLNGSVSKIPAFYTVEVREILAGTKYKVEERDYEIPDGYSRTKYVLYDSVAVPGGSTWTSSAPEGIMPSDGNERDPHVDIYNIKGFGLRVYKNWSDADYMSYRAPAYFAVFIGNSATPVPGTLRQLAYTDSSQTLYWYFDILETGRTFSEYSVREVAVTDPVVDANGYVTSYTSLTRVNDAGTVTLDGTQKGDTGAVPYEYSVHYGNTVEPDTNVRVFNVSNERPGLVIRKLSWGDTDNWGGQPLEGAEFALKRGNTVIGTFVSDASGFVTEAYLSENAVYTLDETKSPQGHYGMQDPVTVVYSGGTYTLSGGEAGFCRMITDSVTSGKTLEIRNRCYDLRFEKQDGSDPLHPPLEGVHFALHKEVTVGGVTQIDFRPMTGYEDLVTDANGIIPLLNNTLVPGVYSLRETQALPGYESMRGYLDFRVDARGNVTVLNEEYSEWFTRRMEGDTIVYSFSIPNVLETTPVRLVKVREGDDAPLAGAVFSIYGSDGVTLFEVGGVIQQNLVSMADGVFFDGRLAPGTYYIEETVAPGGYDGISGMMTLTVSGNAVTLTLPNGQLAGTVTTDTGDDPGNPSEPVYVLSVRNASSQTELPHTGGGGVYWSMLLAVLGLTTMFVMKRQSVQVHKDEPEPPVFW